MSLPTCTLESASEKGKQAGLRQANFMYTTTPQTVANNDQNLLRKMNVAYRTVSSEIKTRQE